MPRILKRMQQKISDRQGLASMSAVLCLMLVIMAISLSLLLASYQMFASVNDNVSEQRAYQQAKTFSETLRQSLEGENINTKVQESNSLEQYLYKLLRNYGGRTQTLTMQEADSGYDRIRLTITTQDSSETKDDTKTRYDDSDSLKKYLTIRATVLDSDDQPQAAVTSVYSFSQDEYRTDGKDGEFTFTFMRYRN